MLSVRVPVSKSLSNRLLMLRTLIPEWKVYGLSDADDTRLLGALLQRVEAQTAGEPLCLDVQNCGTAFRFLLPYLANRPGHWVLTGSERMKVRPIRPLIDVLKLWGADVELPPTGSLPLRIYGKPLQPCDVSVDISESSQFLSALLLLLPSFEKEVRITYSQETAVSLPYVQMTISLMRHVGFNVEICEGEVHYRPSSIRYPLPETPVEGDWSSAAFWWVWTALQPNAFQMRVQDLAPSILQPDAAIQSILAPWGVSAHFDESGALLEKKRPLHMPFLWDWDASNNPDLLPLMVVFCVLSGTKAVCRKADFLKGKESDRIAALKYNLSAFASFEMRGRDLWLSPMSSSWPETLSFKGFSDHRIVMALSLFALFRPVRITDRESVSKSYPEFWEQWEKCLP